MDTIKVTDKVDQHLDPKHAGMLQVASRVAWDAVLTYPAREFDVHGVQWDEVYTKALRVGAVFATQKSYHFVWVCSKLMEPFKDMPAEGEHAALLNSLHGYLRTCAVILDEAGYEAA